LLYVTVQMPMNLPSSRIKKEDIVCRGVFPVQRCSSILGPVRFSRGLHTPVGLDHLQLGVPPDQTRQFHLYYHSSQLTCNRERLRH
jgi:hypothetical protein